MTLSKRENIEKGDEPFVFGYFITGNFTVNDLPYGEIKFEDTYKQQEIDLDKFKIDRSRRCRIRFRIVDTYKGAKSNQVAVSDIQLIGKTK